MILEAEFKNQQHAELALGPYRVLDLTQGGCLLCGKIFGDFGADVIKIERPGGDASRNIGPFYKDLAEPEKSLFWFAYNANKRSITLDIETEDGRDIFKRLVKTADFVIESFLPDYLQNKGLGYNVLSQLNPRIILTSITPYGQTGPKALYKASDLTSWASGVMMYMCGDPDRAPTWISTAPQAALNAGVDAFVASLIAHWHREAIGEGDHVDVSIQECVIWTTMGETLAWDMNRYISPRGGCRKFFNNGLRTRWIFPCKDGAVVPSVRGGGGLVYGQSTRKLVKWMAEEGMAPEWLQNFDWENDYDTGTLTQAVVNKVEETIISFLVTKTKAELFEEACKRGILLVPVSNTEDLWHDSQLREREFWATVHHPELGDTLSYCGPFAKLSQTPCQIRRRAPLIGEHNKEIYQVELGISKEQCALLKEANVI